MPPNRSYRKGSDPGDIAAHGRDHHTGYVGADGRHHRRTARSQVDEGLHQIYGPGICLTFRQLDEPENAVEIARMRIPDGP